MEKQLLQALTDGLEQQQEIIKGLKDSLLAYQEWLEDEARSYK